ncbi:uncharacterized protein SAPINGB_P001858 [Magnusiomyces paraingens]|uniref:Vta1/callose synthase N-terminal domain-containing protein n=1 Tax=Magnusiomyces paraingens TaxID=2606893 RepID=A0A5E8BBY0_9ASCO|nr:uncharacterized protein SAPINGB_P001858 [Saprochaete ingens]VVT48599.1 unnamed protein product [Saprochaete ingens]
MSSAAPEKALPPVPPSLKIINPFLLRAHELEQVEPVISYYCKVYAAQEILARNLHRSGDPSVTSFAGDLMDNIEAMRSSNPKLASEDGQGILADDDVARSYVEAFALNVFAKADKEVYDKTSSLATTQRFIAAATFLELLKLFSGEENAVDKDVAEKIKYAKFQAARIAKACKSGENPNDYTPPQPSKSEEEQVDELLADAVASANLDEQNGSAATTSSLTPSAPNGLPDFIDDDISAPQAPTSPSLDNFFVPAPSQAPRSPSPVAPQFPPAAGPIHAYAPTSPSPAPAPAPAHTSLPTYSPPAPAPVPAQEPTGYHHHLTKREVQSILDQSELITVVQKHCKFAISALTYEDMKTAMKELTTAMDLLKKNVPESEFR